MPAYVRGEPLLAALQNLPAYTHTMKPMPSARLLVLAAFVSPPLHGQTLVLPASHVVSGVVFDSVVHRPLVGAVVQAALLDSGRAGVAGDTPPRIFTAITDSIGRFRIGGLPAGQFVIGFQHEALSALGLESPLRAFVLAADPTVTANLAVPSGAMVRAHVCKSPPDGAYDGMLAGFVVDAQRGGTLRGVDVTVRWIEVGVARGKISSAPHHVTATVGDAGTYLACNLPSDGLVALAVSGTGYRRIEAEVSMPEGGVGRRDFRLADSSVVRGTGALLGHVVDEHGMDIKAGTAAIPAIATQAPIQNGRFSMTGLPGGTWAIETRAIGFEPHTALVDVAERASATVNMVMTRKVQTLEAVSVVGKPGRDMKVLTDIQDRLRVASGTAFLAGNPYLESALFAADVVRAARGFTYRGPTQVMARGAYGGTCVSTPTSTPRIKSMANAPDREVVIYLDGVRIKGGLEMLNDMLPIKEVLAIETYPDVASAPFLWRTNDACAVIAVWSKR